MVKRELSVLLKERVNSSPKRCLVQCPLKSITSYDPNNKQIRSRQISTKFEGPALLYLPGKFPLTQSPIRVHRAEIYPKMRRNPSMLKPEWAKTGE